jgi:hypothetical protein
MSLCSRLCVFAIGIITLPSIGVSQENVVVNEGSFANETSQATQETSPDLTPSLEGIESAIRSLIREESEDERQRDDDQATQGLEAQSEMAEWAQEVAIASIAAALLSLIGVFLIGMTLHYTKRAAMAADSMLLEAKAATTVAEKSASDTLKIGQAQTRAYVSVSELSLEWTNEKDSITKFEFIILNSGSSPAFGASTFSGVAVVDPAGHHKTVGIDAFRDLLNADGLTAQPSIIPSRGNNKVMIDRVISPHEVARLENGEIDIFGYTYTKYRDVFDVDQFTENCFRLVPEKTEKTGVLKSIHFEHFSPLINAS